jgi:hypothetical protein
VDEILQHVVCIQHSDFDHYIDDDNVAVVVSGTVNKTILEYERYRR